VWVVGGGEGDGQLTVDQVEMYTWVVMVMTYRSLGPYVEIYN
jgi:hypothetical protein